LRILLIDDSAADRELFGELLAESGLPEVTFACAATAAEGGRLLNLGAYDIAFVDYRLPGMKGTALIEGARRAGAAQPIFCLTGLDDPRLDLEAERAGASFHLSKDGLTAALLSRTIRFALRNAAPSMPADAADRFKLAQEAANIGNWDWDAIAGVMTWDAMMYQLFGCAPDETMPPREVCRRALLPDTWEGLERGLKDCIERDTPFRSDFDITWQDGTVRAMRAAGRIIKGINGRARRVSGISWDITEIRQLVAELAQARDDAQSANQAKSRFLAGMSHELRTPMNAILGNARLLQREGGLNPAQAARVDTMLGAGSHLLQLIRCVLDLSEIESAKVVLQPEPVDVRALAGGCLDMVHSLAEEKHLALHLVLADAVPPLVLADAVRLRQILLNLLGNAAKFTSRGSITLHVDVVSETDGAALRFDVADTGPGVPEAARARLFREFGRVQDGALCAEEGAGLGLALSSRLATLMRGQLCYRENPGGGSIFRLDMPLEAACSPQAGSVMPDSASPAPLRKLRVLVVDDSDMSLEIAASFIGMFGHDVTCAGSGEAAVAAVAATAFDAVFMDVQMPGMDGLEATRRIRGLPGPHARVPVVALTAQVFSNQLAACRDAGMTAHLAKPFTEASLKAILGDIAAAAPDSTILPA
jgi:signal transduction histidine kinase/DNA-binding response OmpR family regulator